MVPPNNLGPCGRLRSLPRRVRAPAGPVVACNGDDDPGPQSTTTSTAATTTTTGASTTTAPTCTGAGADTATKAAPAQSATGVALLTDVRTGRQPCADRVVFDFRAGSRPGYSVGYERGPFTFGQSDMPVTVAGERVPGRAHDAGERRRPRVAGRSAAPTTGPESIVPPGLTHVREIRRLEDFEATLVWVIGLDAQRPFSVGTLDGPPRVYVDVVDG